MAPLVTAWEDLEFVSEEVDPETGEFQYLMLVAIEDDAVYFGQLDVPKQNATFQQVTSALSPLLDDEIFPEWPPSDTQITRAPDALPPNLYIKRPSLAMYDVFKMHNVLHLIPTGLIEEAQTMEYISQHPHSNIIKYHGCRARRGRVVGIVLDRHPSNLEDCPDIKTVDKESFMDSLESAIHHLHSLGWAHNDLNPSNILVSKAGMPVIIDFDSARKIGQDLGTSRGTAAWIDGEMKDYTTSEKRHDISALAKIRAWLDKQSLES